MTYPLLNAMCYRERSLALLYLPNCLSFSVPRMYADYTHIPYADSDFHLIQSIARVITSSNYDVEVDSLFPNSTGKT